MLHTEQQYDLFTAKIWRNTSEYIRIINITTFFPLQLYIIYENEIASKDGNYYIVYDIYIGGVFYMYLNEPIRFVVIQILKCIDTSNLPIRKFSKCFFTLQKKKISKIRKLTFLVLSL